LLVGLMGHYYGSCPPNETVSFTELEYRTAKDAGLPRLMFAAPDDFSSPISLRESDDSFARQQALRREVMSERVVASFDTPERLAAAVTKALFVWHEDRRRAAQPAAPTKAEEAGPAAAPEAESTLDENPYRGLEAFRKEDADRFFRPRGIGRSALEQVPGVARGSCGRRSAEPAASGPRRVGLGKVVGGAGGSPGQAGS
jgi:hypothetical protein